MFMAKTKNKNVLRKNGKFVSPDKAEPAIFSSKYRNQTVVMKPTTDDEKGRRIEFNPDGRYETKDPQEIDFLKHKAQNPGPFCKINLVQDVKIKEKND